MRESKKNPQKKIFRIKILPLDMIKKTMIIIKISIAMTIIMKSLSATARAFPTSRFPSSREVRVLNRGNIRSGDGRLRPSSTPTASPTRTSLVSSSWPPRETRGTCCGRSIPKISPTTTTATAT